MSGAIDASSLGYQRSKKSEPDLGSWGDKLKAPYTAEFVGWAALTEEGRVQRLKHSLDAVIEHEIMLGFMNLTRGTVPSAPTFFENVAASHPKLAAAITRLAPEAAKYVGKKLSQKVEAFKPSDDSVSGSPNIPGTKIVSLPVGDVAPHVLHGLQLGVRAIGKLFATHMDVNGHLMYVNPMCYNSLLDQFDVIRPDTVKAVGSNATLQRSAQMFIGNNGDIVICAPLETAP